MIEEDDEIQKVHLDDVVTDSDLSDNDSDDKNKIKEEITIRD